MKKSRLCIVGFECTDLESNAFNLKLESQDQQNCLKIPLNEYESKVVAHIFSNGKKNQLFAYGSMANLLIELDAKIESAEFHINAEDQLIAYLIGIGTFDTPFKSPVRPIDAIILCILNRCPIYCVEESAEVITSEKEKKQECCLDDLSLKSLKSLLAEYIDSEKYEEACTIRDLIQTRYDKFSMLSHAK